MMISLKINNIRHNLPSIICKNFMHKKFINIPISKINSNIHRWIKFFKNRIISK